MPFTAARDRRNAAVRLTAMHRLPLLVLHAQEEVVAGDAGVVDQDVEAAHRGLGRRHQRLDRILVGQVRRDHVDALAELARQRVERRAARARERDRRALGVQRARDGAADAAGRAGDERLAAVRSNMACPQPVIDVLGVQRPNAVTSSGVPIAVPEAPAAMRLHEPGQHLAGAKLIESVHALARHEGDALAPAHRAGHLPHERVPDRVRAR